MNLNKSFIIKRNGLKEPVYFDKITDRINKLINLNELKYLDPILVAQKVVARIYPGITTEELDIESAETCVNLSTTHPLYAHLGGRILISNLHKKTLNTFSDKIKLISTINHEWLQYVLDNMKELDNIIDYNRDYMYDYFGFKTLEKAYLLKNNNKIIERPQDMLLRTAITLQQGNIELIKKTYNELSLGKYIHASPTLFNAGTKHMQLSSCFLLGTNDDLSSITTTINSCCQISKWAGGIGLHVSNIRAKNSIIKGTGGLSNGLVPFLKVFNELARWIDQGGKRPGSIAIYLEPHHPDILDFLDLRKNFGSDTDRTRDLFLALWISDLFMMKVENDEDWYLLSPDECPNLNEVFGDEYNKLYDKYVSENKYRSIVKARKIWMSIIDSQIETGMPYILYKDTINKKNNQKNLGTIKSSNLCAEIVQYSDHTEYSVCNLGSISLKKYINEFDISGEWKIYTKKDCIYCNYAKNYLTNSNIIFIEIDNIDEIKKILNKDNITLPQIFHNDTLIGGWDELYKYTACTYNFDELYNIAYLATINLNNVIDINYYPVEQTRKSNLRHRPIGLGIQGLADTLVLLRISFDSNDSIEFNYKIMETIYLASITASNDIAIDRTNKINNFIIAEYNNNNFIIPEYYDKHFILKNNNKLYHELKLNKFELNTKYVGAYSTFEGSLFSEGKFQFDMYNTKFYKLFYEDKWTILREKVIKYGTRNSLLTSLMPTASTSQILGNNECFEFFTNNIYTRKTQAGDFMLVNKYLVNDLLKINLWNNEIKDKIIAHDGSIQHLIEIPLNIKNIYKTIWEIKQSWVLKNAQARSYFTDQSQSMNIFMDIPDYQRLTSSHFYSWKNELKTGIYYLRSKPSNNAVKFTISPLLINNNCDTCSA